ncbi:MAG: fatty acyl-CoA reductase [Gemmatimonadetes bacterium]|nr:fatty acyl-CoA reductase [Gemmatimonadota bacterium]
MTTEAKRLAPLQDRYAGQRILLTGATGLLGKSVLEKILRDLPSVEKVHLLVRSRRSVDAAARIDWQIARSPVFDRLRDEWQSNFHSSLSSKVVPVSGDLARRHLGLDDAAYEKLAGEVTMIINCGATCSFREQFDRALQINALGARRILKLAQDAGNVPLVHVSTAYVYETAYEVSPERVIPDGHTLRSLPDGEAAQFSLDEEIDHMLARCAAIRGAAFLERPDDSPGEDGQAVPVTEEARDRWRQNLANRATIEYGTEVSREHGWRDAYQFTKSLAEQLLARDRGSVPLSIVRPSIIEGTLSEPVPGWFDRIRMFHPIAVEYGRGNVQEFAGYEDTKIDLVPCDLVTNLVLAAAPPDDPTHFEVYQIASARTNPVTLGEMTTFLREAFQRDSADLPGRTWQDRKFKWTPPRIYERNVERARRRLELLRDLYSWLGLKRRARRAAVRLRLLKRMAEFADVYGFYVERGPEFETENSRELLRALHPIDRDRFSWDIDAVAWRDYFLDAWVPGLMNVADDRPAGARVPGADATSARGQSAERTSDEPRQVSA